jgi:excisionase family DNA binding protein
VDDLLFQYAQVQAYSTVRPTALSIVYTGCPRSTGSVPGSLRIDRGTGSRVLPIAMLSKLPVLLTVTEVAALLRHHPGTIRAWIRTGRLEGHGWGREMRIPASELKKWGVDLDHAAICYCALFPEAGDSNSPGS